MNRLQALPLALVALATSAVAVPAHAAGSTSFASPTGSGTSCTQAAPCSLDEALSRGTDVELADGTYRRTTPVALTSANSNTTIRAAAGAKPVIDGGTEITGWSIKKTPWGTVEQAKIPDGVDSRDLWVDGKHATRARGSVAEAFGSLTKTATGFTASRKAWKLPGADLVWSGQGHFNIDWQAWSHVTCPAAIDGTTTVTVSKPCWDLATPTAQQGVDQPSWVEGPLRLLNEPGEFSVDAAAGYVYYKPVDGQTMDTAKAVLGTSQGLVRGDGVDNLTVTGISFAHDTSLHAARPEGHVDIQTAVFKEADTTGKPAEAAVQFTNSSNITLDNVAVARTGATGIGFAGGTTNNRVANSTVTDTGASGISFGTTNAAETRNTGNSVERTTIARVGRVQPDGVGIFGGYLRGSRFVGNHITDMPYSGIALGWGWGKANNSSDNHITDNFIHGVMRSHLFDGGNIYVMGTTGADGKRSEIARNDLADDHQPYGALYLDGSSSNWDVTGNSVADTSTNWVFVQDVASQWALNNTVTGNFTDTATMRANTSPTNQISNNTVTSTPAQSSGLSSVTAYGDPTPA